MSQVGYFCARSVIESDWCEAGNVGTHPSQLCMIYDSLKEKLPKTTLAKELLSYHKVWYVMKWGCINPTDAEATLSQGTTMQSWSCWYSLDSSKWVLSDEYPYDRVSVIFSFLPHFLLSKLVSSIISVKCVFVSVFQLVMVLTLPWSRGTGTRRLRSLLSRGSVWRNSCRTTWRINAQHSNYRHSRNTTTVLNPFYAKATLAQSTRTQRFLKTI